MRGKTFWNMVWELVSPILLYLLLSISLTGVLGLAVPVLEEPENSMWLLTLVNGFQIPVFLWLYRKESWGTERHRKESFGKESQTAAGERPVWKRSFGLSDLLAAALGGLLLARGFNGLIGLTPLPQLFPAYESVTEAMYGGSLLSQTLASVVTAPLLEEILTRGLIYGRLRPYFTDPRPAVLLGALIFALFHGNVVQGIYAFFLGLYGGRSGLLEQSAEEVSFSCERVKNLFCAGADGPCRGSGCGRLLRADGGLRGHELPGKRVGRLRKPGISFVLPAILAPAINQVCRRLDWVKDGDLKLS